VQKSEDGNTVLLNELKQLHVHDHLCLIYNTQEEQLAAAVPFILLGLEREERCIYIADDNDVATILHKMKNEGVNVDSAIKSAALAVITKEDAYLKQGYFDPGWMIDFIKELVDKARADGFKALRVTGEMTWALGEEQGLDRLMEYEAKLNYFFPQNDVLAVCQYNRSRFHPETIKKAIHTHPLVISGSMVYKNPDYLPPDEFLKPDAVSLSSISWPEHEKHMMNEYKTGQQDEDRYKILISTIPDIIYELDPTGHFTFISNAVEELGYGPQELLGKHFREIIHPDDFDNVASSIVLPKYRGKMTGDTNSPKLFDERRTSKRMTRNLEVRLSVKDRK